MRHLAPPTAWLPPLLALALACSTGLAGAAGLPTEPAQAAQNTARQGYDGVVEAVRQTTLAAQVSGAVVELAVKAGDRVQAGQLLLRIDARTADQSAAAVDAQVQAAKANLDVATREYERQKQLFAKKYISQAALDRAEAEYRAASAQVHAQSAQAGAARTQTGLHVVRAPYAGVVAEVPAMLGDMAMPGRPLLTLYDPAALRITAAVPQTAVPGTASPDNVRAELPGQSGDRQWPQATRVQVLPTVDPATHTLQLRADLPTPDEAAAWVDVIFGHAAVRSTDAIIVVAYSTSAAVGETVGLVRARAADLGLQVLDALQIDGERWRRHGRWRLLHHDRRSNRL